MVNACTGAVLFISASILSMEVIRSCHIWVGITTVTSYSNWALQWLQGQAIPVQTVT